MVGALLKRITVDRSRLALCFFIAFILVNTGKIVVFKSLITESAATLKIAALLPGFFGALVVMTACFIVLTRLNYRFPIIVFYVFQTMYVTANLLYFAAFQGYLHISQYMGLFSEGFDLLTHAAIQWDAHSLFMVADLPLLIGVLILYPRIYVLNKKRLFKPVAYGVSIVFLIYFYRWEVPMESPLATMNNAYAADAAVVKKYGLLTFNILDLLNLKGSHELISRLSYGPVLSPVKTDTVPMPAPNILILQIESLDAYIIHQKHHKRHVAPYLHSLSEKCVFFPYLMSYHLAGSTSDCEFSTINSVEPLDDYPSIKLRDYDYPNSLLKRLDKTGYFTVAYHGNRGSYFNRTAAFNKMGFKKFYDMQGMNLRDAGWGATDSSVLFYLESRLPHVKQPFLAYCITMSSHEPFTLITPYYRNKRFSDIREGTVRNYYNSINYVDHLLARFIPAIQKSCPNTIIMIYGDHTPTMPKCAYRKAVVKKNDRLFEFVPLFIITPETLVYREKKCAASFLDIAPTVLALTRCTDTIRSYGANLLEFPVQDRVIPFRKGLFSRKTLYREIARNQKN
ncbi:MAG: LTA synthase family protein [Chitinispirillaceae bacterium]|nr:LTA synthase family protein [Chitinispirillaceae bacterium]